MTDFSDHITADTHLWHNGIVRYCQRPGYNYGGYHDYSRHTREIIDNWNESVGPEDTILHLGDLYFRPRNDDNEAERRAEVIRNLNGRKKIIMGNHDDPYGKEHFEELGFEVVEAFSVVKDDVTFYFTHYPMRSVPKNSINIHGHIHNNYIDCIGRGHINVGVDMRAMSPVPTEVIMDNGIYRIKVESTRRDHHA